MVTFSLCGILFLQQSSLSLQCNSKQFSFFHMLTDLGEADCEIDVDDWMLLEPDEGPSESTESTEVTSDSLQEQISKLKPAPKSVKLKQLKVECDRLLDATPSTSTGVTRAIGTVTVVPNAAGKKGKMHPCTECTVMYETVAGLRYHLLHTHNITLSFPCEECGEKFQNNRDLRTHMRSHSDKVHYCQHCNKYCSVHKHDVTRHENGCPENPAKKWKCNKCPNQKLFTSDEGLFAHLRSKHKLSGKFGCVYCKTLFKTQKDLDLHKCPVSRRR